MPKKKKQARVAFEKADKEPSEWLKEEPMVCEAIRMQPELDPWEKKGRIVRQPDTTEQKRKKLSELSLNVEHFISDESGAAVA